MENNILGIDIGTTSLKTVMFDASGAKLASATVEYSLITPNAVTVEAPCGVYMESIERCLELMKEGGAALQSIGVVGFSVQGETLIFLDEEGEPLQNAIVWMDNRAGEQARELCQRFGNEQCYRVTGQVSFEACWPAAKVLWLKQQQPQLFSRTRHILLLEDYIIYLLTGRFVTEGSLLTSTLYWDITTKRYWPEMLSYIGIDTGMLPEIMEPGRSVGRILPEMAQKLGISPTAVICTGCLDQAAGAIGAGNIRPGIFSENIGAALAVCVPTKKLTYDAARQMPVHYFALPDTYMMHTFTTGGMCLRWFRDAFCEQELALEKATGLDSYYLMDKEAEKAPPGSAGLIALPHLQGSMAPDVNLAAKGVFYGATLQHGKPHFIRSIMESLGYIICRNLEAIGAMGLQVDEIRTLGGGSKSEIWNQIKADITGKPLVLTESSQDTACLGAAILAGAAAGIYKSVQDACDSMVKVKKVYRPNMQNHAVYMKQYEKFKLLFSSLQELFSLDAEN